MGLRKKDLQKAAEFLLELMNVAQETPGLFPFFNSINCDVFVSLKLCVSQKFPIPTSYICGTITFTLADIIDYIKEEITTIAVEILSLTTYASIDIDFIEIKFLL
jgi:hypothetical protein